MIDFNVTPIFGLLTTIGILLVIFCIFVLFLGYGGIVLFGIMFVVGLWIGLHGDETNVGKQSSYYFTDEDFLHCKVGEWVSRP